MKNCILLTLTLALFSFVFSEEVGAQAIAIGNPALTSNLENLQDVYDWWYQNGFLIPRNIKMMRAAVDEIKRQMKPGEVKLVHVVVAGEGDNAVFRRLTPDEGAIFLSADERVASSFNIVQEGIVFIPTIPTTPPPRESFEIWKQNLGSGDVDYDDFTVLCNAIIHSMGSGLVDLVNRSVFAPFDGTVILLAQENASDYEVYNVATKSKDPKKYPKGSTIKKLGTTVWILSEDKKYVAVVANLAKADVSLGQRLTSAKTSIGKQKDANKPTLQIYRIFSPDQYFLRDSGNKKPVQLTPQK